MRMRRTAAMVLMLRRFVTAQCVDMNSRDRRRVGIVIVEGCVVLVRCDVNFVGRMVRGVLLSAGIMIKHCRVIDGDMHLCPDAQPEREENA